MSRTTTILALIQTLLVIGGFFALGAVLKMSGYPDALAVRWNPLAVFLREHGVWLLRAACGKLSSSAQFRSSSVVGGSFSQSINEQNNTHESYKKENGSKQSPFGSVHRSGRSALRRRRRDKDQRCRVRRHDFQRKGVSNGTGNGYR